MDQSSFADCFEICDLEFDRWNDIQGLEVMPILSPHPVETSVFLFRTLWEDGYRQYAHFADIVSLDLLGQMRASDGQPGISQAFYDKVVTDYATPAYVKKLDVGGGLIHGVAEDFRGDASNKIILAHTSRPLTAAEKEIGSDAPFGTVDVIVPGNHDYVWRSAYEALRTYFPRTEHHELRVLLNSPLSLSNPGTMLLREGEEVKEIYLVITGTVEVFDSTSQVNGVLSSGAMVGEMAAMESAPSEMTFRTSSFVQALRISARLYREFLRRNDLERDVMALHERRNFLRSSWLCSDGVSDVTLNRLAKDMPTMVFDAADVVDPLGLLAFVKSGVVEMRVGRQLVELLTEGDFFCEEVAIFAKPPMYTVHAASRAEIYLASPPVIRDVPIMLWKLLESHERRLQLCALDVAASGRVRTRRSGRRRLRA